MDWECFAIGFIAGVAAALTLLHITGWAVL